MRRSGSLLLVLAVIATIALLGVVRPAVAPARRMAAPVARPQPLNSVAGAPVSNAPAGSGREAAALLALIEPANAAALSAALPAPAQKIEYVRVNRALAEGKQSPFWQPRGAGRVQLPLPSGGSLAVVIDASEMLGADRFTSTGHVEGAPQSRAVFAYNQGFLTADIETAQHAYALRPATTDATQLYEVDPALVGTCGGARHPVITPAIVAAAAARKAQAELASAGSTTVAATTAAAASEAPVIDLLMLYTQDVKTTLTGDARTAALQSEFDASTAKVNNELAASQVTARVRLVGIAQTTYDETVSASNKVQDDALTALATPDDGKMDEIHALRDQLGADIVCLALNRADTASIGLSYVLDTPSSENASADMTNPMFAFAVVQYATIAGTDVVPHELGHVLGCAHARGDPGATGTKDGAFTFSYGYRFWGSNGRQYHDIMAYSPGTPLSYYSNPQVTVPSPVLEPIGVTPGGAGESDCALTIEKDAFEVASYRLQRQAPPAGTLINVSTRAHVGTGENVLIGGFVVDGTLPKRVLVRAPGPALTAYGVTDALANPMVTVHGGSTVVGGNDDWSNQPNAGDVGAAIAQTGAFAFAAGSTDAAALLTLSPGAYSAVVEGVGGTTGSGMVEVYDVDRTGNKIINLSTRAYADAGQPIIGGFVVNGDAGTTKRILIRVLGPTLGKNFGITDAMDDPMLELHNGNGDLLLKDDDWSSGTTTGVASATADFSPLVKTYSEQQIFATGYAPSNRREPCIMLDLPPGNYSVIAQPFQDLTTTPPEPASPGVATVEVYEISQ